jgi:hypothetical protein
LTEVPPLAIRRCGGLQKYLSLAFETDDRWLLVEGSVSGDRAGTEETTLVGARAPTLLEASRRCWAKALRSSET